MVSGLRKKIHAGFEEGCSRQGMAEIPLGNMDSSKWLVNFCHDHVGV